MTSPIFSFFLLLAFVCFAPVVGKAQDANAETPSRETDTYTQTTSDPDENETPPANVNSTAETPAHGADIAASPSEQETAAPAPEASQESPAHEAPVDLNKNCWQYGTAKASKCFTKQSYKADEALNSVYAELISKQDDDGAQKLTGAERAWMAFRDKQCEFLQNGNEAASIYANAISQCRVSLEQKHTEELKEILASEKAR